MGVKGLWQIVESIKRPVNQLESLSGKTLAIDVSIWMHQWSSIASKKRQHDLSEHDIYTQSLIDIVLEGILHRLCKLVYYNIHPILVFDGPQVPFLKKATIAARQERKDSVRKRLGRILGQHHKKKAAKLDEYDISYHQDPSFIEENHIDNIIPDVEPFSQEFYELSLNMQCKILRSIKFKESSMQATEILPAREFSKFQLESLIHRGKYQSAIDQLVGKRYQYNSDHEQSSEEEQFEQVDISKFSPVKIDIPTEPKILDHPPIINRSIEYIPNTSPSNMEYSSSSKDYTTSSVESEQDEVFEPLIIEKEISRQPDLVSLNSTSTNDKIIDQIIDIPKVANFVQNNDTSISDDIWDQQVLDDQNIQYEFSSSHKDISDLVQEIASFLGIPCITSPMEADAQCASLCKENIVDGVITDDSDILVFMDSELSKDKIILRNMFRKNHIVYAYRISALIGMGLTRNRLIELAYLLGSDYNIGVNGVGIVTAVEILSSIPRSDDDSLSSMSLFKDWVTDEDSLMTLPLNKYKIALPNNFPDPRVRHAFIFPNVKSFISNEHESLNKSSLDLTNLAM